MGDKTLFPVINVPETLDTGAVLDKRYKKSVKWDLEKGDFARDGANNLVETDGIDAYMTWCIKMAQTERYKCLAYPNQIGCEFEEAMKKPSTKACESAIRRTITEALCINPRTEYVRGFEFEWAGDTLRCSFTVKGIDSAEFHISI